MRAQRKLRDLGVQIVQACQACDSLVAPNIVRTVKFLCAMARGVMVLSTYFIDMLDSGEVPCPDEYVLRDEAAEKRYSMNLERSVARAKANKGRLLRGIPVYCTEKIRNDADSYRAITEANGVIFKLYRARSSTTIKSTTAEDGHAPPEPVYLVSSSSVKQMWPRFKEMAEKGNMEPRIVSADWLIDVALAQQVRFDKKFLMEKQAQG